MPVTNGYCTQAQVKADLGIGDTADDALIDESIAAASRQIDAECGRRFWQDATVQTRLYHAENPLLVEVDDISTLTGLVVKSDVSGVGLYDLTLAITTDFLAYPLNADKETPVRPFEELRVVTGLTTSGLGFACYGTRPGVQVTAKFGWPAVPDDVTKACIIQATQLYKAKDAVFGAIALGDTGAAMRVRPGLNPQAAGLLDTYRKPAVG